MFPSKRGWLNRGFTLQSSLVSRKGAHSTGDNCGEWSLDLIENRRKTKSARSVTSCCVACMILPVQSGPPFDYIDDRKVTCWMRPRGFDTSQLPLPCYTMPLGCVPAPLAAGIANINAMCILGSKPNTLAVPACIIGHVLVYLYGSFTLVRATGIKLTNSSVVLWCTVSRKTNQSVKGVVHPCMFIRSWIFHSTIASCIRSTVL